MIATAGKPAAQNPAYRRALHCLSGRQPALRLHGSRCAAASPTRTTAQLR